MCIVRVGLGREKIGGTKGMLEKYRMKPKIDFNDDMLQVHDADIVCPTHILKIFNIDTFYPQNL